MANDYWRTPDTTQHPILTICEKVFNIGKIDLDPTADYLKLVRASQHYTEKEDCLKQTWSACNAFMNPPFSNPYPFISKLALEYSQAHIQEAIILAKLGVLANKGTGSIIRNTSKSVCIWGAGKSSRIAFLNEKGDAVKGADFDCCLIYFGSDSTNFCRVCRNFGLVVNL